MENNGCVSAPPPPQPVQPPRSRHSGNVELGAGREKQNFTGTPTPIPRCQTFTVTTARLGPTEHFLGAPKNPVAHTIVASRPHFWLLHPWGNNHRMGWKGP